MKLAVAICNAYRRIQCPHTDRSRIWVDFMLAPSNPRLLCDECCSRFGVWRARKA